MEGWLGWVGLGRWLNAIPVIHLRAKYPAWRCPHWHITHLAFWQLQKTLSPVSGCHLCLGKNAARDDSSECGEDVSVRTGHITRKTRKSHDKLRRAVRSRHRATNRRKRKVRIDQLKSDEGRTSEWSEKWAVTVAVSRPPVKWWWRIVWQGRHECRLIIVTQAHNS